MRIKKTTACNLLLCLLSLPVMAQVKPADYVNPIIGTNGMGHTFPGACVPHGIVQLSPDTDTIPHNVNGVYQPRAYEYCAGYQYKDSTIVGFSHTHLSGTGRGELLDILVMPTTGSVKFEPGDRENPDSGYRSRFSHKNEVAKPGYYSVMLDDYQIRAELTATKRAGFHRYTFSEDDAANLIIDLNHSYKTDSILNGYVEIINDTLVVGSHRSKGWGEKGERFYVEHEVFFALRLSQDRKSVV